MGHGLDIVYPYQNRYLARRILDQGGALLSEYPIHTGINAAYFPARNRIVAALSDATIVVEAAERGGALITANLANSYHREVFAVPGRLDDRLSDGCNNLIINNKAIMIRNAGDLFYQMGWKNTFDRQRQREEQLSIFAALSSNEQSVVNLLNENREMTLDEIVEKSGLSLPKIASTLMDLELKNVVRCLPGRLYKVK
jgi:DNA processing protein